MGKKEKESKESSSKSSAAKASAASSSSVADESQMSVSVWLKERVRMNVGGLESVRALNLGSRGLRGLPEDLSPLRESLVTLDLRHNRIERLPESLGTLTRLEVLSLCNLPLTPKAVPDSVLRLSNLRELDLSGLGLGSLPEDLGGRLPQLVSLDVSRNAFSTLPSSLGRLAQLKTLTCDGGQLCELPEALFLGDAALCHALQQLNLEGNRLSSLPSSISQLRALTDVNLSYNALSALPAGFGTHLSTLRTLELSSNPLDDLSGVAWASLVGLETLTARHGRLRSLPAALGALPRLTLLDLSHNALTALPPFPHAAALRTLRLCGNELAALPTPFHFGGKTQIGGVLDISANALESMDSWSGCEDFVEVNVSGNKLRTLPGGVVAQLTQATKLLASDNGLVSLPAELAAMTSLTELDVRNGQLQSLPAVPFCPPSLRKLVLCGNRLEQVPAACLAGFSSLQSLNLAGNRLTLLPPGLGASCAGALRELVLGGNRLEQLPDDLGALTQLTALYIGWNNLRTLPAALATLPKLSVLHLSGNPLSSFPDSFKSLRSLKQLYLAALPCVTSVPAWVAQNKPLEVLDVGFNAKLTSLPSALASCAFLERVDVSGCANGTAAVSLPKDLRARPMLQLIAHASPPATPFLNAAMADMQGRRRNMEDAQAILHPFRNRADEAYACVFDGHGGDKAARLACAEHPVLLEKRLSACAEEDPAALLEALAQSVRDVAAKMTLASVETSGCTGVVAYWRGNRVYVANVGDARAVMMAADRDGKDRAFALSHDHKPYNRDEEERIRALGGRVKPDGRVQGMLAVSRALGDLELQPFISFEPYLYHHAWTTGSQGHIILACDGVWDMLSNSRASQIVKSVKHPGLAAAKLRDLAFLFGSSDNISVSVCFPFGGTTILKLKKK